MMSSNFSSHQTAGDAISALGKTSPPVAVTTAMLAGLSLETWVAIATLSYIALQAAYLLWKWARELTAKKAGPDA
tara:strand:- start:440 stop:664 length:225 start_codon:yes stop_codon:yes gene_type:complete